MKKIASSLRFKSSLVALACLLSAAGSAQAQSLQALWAQASQHDAAFLAAVAQSQAQPYRSSQARAALRPQVGLAAGVTAAAVQTPDGTQAKASQKLAASLGLSVQQTLYSRSAAVAIDKAQVGENQSLLGVQAQQQSLLVRLAQAYFDVLNAQTVEHALRATQDAARNQQRFARRNFEVGNAAITDARQAQAQVDLIEAQLRSARNDLTVKQNVLEQLVGQNNVRTYALKDKDTPWAAQDQAESVWVNAAVENGLAVRQAKLSLEQAQLDLALARASASMTVQASGQVGGSIEKSRADTVMAGWQSANARALNSQVGLNLNLPLFTGGASDAKIAEAAKLLEAAQLQVQAAQRSAQQSASQAYLTWQSLRGQVDALRTAVSSSELLLKAAKLGYEVGMSTSLDVLNAHNQLFQTQRDLAKARHAGVMAFITLRQASGDLSEQDLAQLDTHLQLP